MMKGRKRYSVVIAILVCLIGIFYVYQFSNTAESAACSQIPIALSSLPERINEPFDPNMPPEGEKFYTVSDEEVWTENRFDVDSDGIQERILTANIAMNHTPHVLQIVKDGYVIFKAEGANVQAVEVSDHNGFILNQTLDWNKGIVKQTKYVHDNGRFIPKWYTKGCK